MILILYTDLELSTKIERRCKLGTEEKKMNICNEIHEVKQVRCEIGFRDHCSYILSRSQNQDEGKL